MNSNCYKMDYVIIKGKIDYILSSCPNEINIKEYSTLLKKNNVKYLVNFCDNQYSLKDFDNIEYRNLLIEDGSIPDELKLNEWKQICTDCIKEKKNIALHCVSGMGRAPSMLCVALIEYENYNNLDSVEILRKKRKGCINARQLKYIMNYRKNKGNYYCIIM